MTPRHSGVSQRQAAARHPSMQWTGQARINLMDMSHVGASTGGGGADPVETSRAHRIAAWAAAVGTVGYLLPWAIGVQRNLPRHRSLFWVNLLLGWTGIGWILAMIEVLLWRPPSFWGAWEQAPNRGS